MSARAHTNARAQELLQLLGAAQLEGDTNARIRYVPPNTNGNFFAPSPRL